MPTVFMRKGQMVNGVFVPAGMAVYGLTGAEAALAAQGGDGLVLPDPDAPSVSGGGILADKIRTALQGAAGKNYRNTFWNQPGAWTSGQVVRKGEARVSNGAIWLAKTSGTCGANAPTGVTPVVAQPFSQWFDASADGSVTATTPNVQWVYWCKSPTVTYTDADTTVSLSYSTSNDAALTNVFTPVAGSFPGGWNAYVPLDGRPGIYVPVVAGTMTSTAIVDSRVGVCLKSPNAVSLQPEVTAGGALGLLPQRFLFNAAGNVNAGVWQICIDAPEVQIEASQFDIGAASCMVLVDGVSVMPGLYNPGGSGANASGYLKVTLGGQSKPRVVTFSGFSIRSIKIRPNYNFYEVPEPALRVLALGDSTFAGSGVGPANDLQTWPDLVCNELGLLSPSTNWSTGGTGFENAGTGFSFLGRLQQSVSTSNRPENSATLPRAIFDIVLVGATGNDGSSSTTLAATMLQTLRLLRQYQPTALIICHGPWAGTTSANITYGSSQLALAFDQFADSNSRWIPTLSDAPGGPWVSGTGTCRAGNIAATGNSSVFVGGTGATSANDDLHPSDAGIGLYARRSVQAIRAALGL